MLTALAFVFLLVVPLTVIGVAVSTLRRGTGDLDFRSVYFLVIAFLANLVAFILALVLASQIIGLFVTSSNLNQIADPAAFFVVVLPVGIFHLWKAVRYAYSKSSFGVLKVYSFAWMVMALIAAMIAGGMFVSNFFKLLFNGIQPVKLDPALVPDLVSALVNILIAAAVWFYHRKLADSLPSNANPAEVKSA